MFDKRRFLAQLTLRGVTKKELARYLGINEVTLYRKIDNNGSFTREEISKMIPFLKIENVEEIFFAERLTETQDGGI